MMKNFTCLFLSLILLWGCNRYSGPYEVVMETYADGKPHIVITFEGKGEEMKKLIYHEYFNNDNLKRETFYNNEEFEE